jgi:hypothetical protein
VAVVGWSVVGGPELPVRFAFAGEIDLYEAKWMSACRQERLLDDDN